MKMNGNLVNSLKGSDNTLTIKNFSLDLYIFEFANDVTGTVNADIGEVTKKVIDSRDNLGNESPFAIVQ